MEDSKIAILADELHSLVLQSSDKERRTYFADQLLTFCRSGSSALQNVASIEDLQDLVQLLTDSARFFTHKVKNELKWGARPTKVASALRTVSNEALSVYGVVEESQTEGIWIKNIRKRTGLVEAQADKAIKQLQTSNLIYPVKSVKNPNQKTFMVVGLVPSEEVTGGVFYDDNGQLDETLVEELGKFIVHWIYKRSWHDTKHHEKQRRPVESTENGLGQGDSRKRSRTEIDDIEDGPVAKSAKRDEGSQVALDPGSEYPTASDILQQINGMGLVRDKNLSESDMLTLLNVLIWDDRLEQINGGYRTVHGVKLDLSMRDSSSGAADQRSEDARGTH